FGSPLPKYYHKFYALWRQYDSLVNLPDYICENSEKLKRRSQLLKLMQFLIGLDEVYAPIRSIIFTTDPKLDVKGAFGTSIDESHRITYSHNVSKTGNKDQSAGSSNSFTDDQYKRLYTDDPYK
ncbi:hypothetical protein Tco_0070491, partial [Tanacetum coccineum]